MLCLKWNSLHKIIRMIFSNCYRTGIDELVDVVMLLMFPQNVIASNGEFFGDQNVLGNRQGFRYIHFTDRMTNKMASK